MWAELRHARLRITDGGLPALPRPDDREHGGQPDDDRSRSSVRDASEMTPHLRELLLAPSDAFVVARVEHHEGNQHGQQHEIGQNHDGHADARRDRHFANHLHGNHQNGHEPDQISQQRDDGGHEQLPERAPCSLHAAEARQRRVTDGTDLLDTVAHADRKDEERHEQSQRIDAVAEQHQRPQLPHDGNDGTAHGHERYAERLAVEPNGEQCEH